MTRSRILVLLALVALAATALVACGGGEESPEEILDGVSFEGVESAGFEASLGVEASGRQAADVDVEVSGQFQAEAGDLPRLAATATVQGTAKGKPVDFEGGLTLLSGHGFVNYKGTVYEIDPNNFGIARGIFLPGYEPKGKEAKSTEIDACRQVLSGIQVSELVEQPRDEGSAEVEGEETTKVSGRLDVGALADAVVELASDSDCRVQLEAISPLPLYELRQVAGEVSGTVEQARIEVYVGDDDIIRRLTTGFTGTRKGQRVTVSADVTLTDVNEAQEIEAPAGGKPLQALFLQLGINPIVFITSSGGEVVTLLLEKISADALG